VVPDASQADSRYLTCYLTFHKTQARLKMLATRGVSQSNISATKLRGFAVPLPSLGEQREMAEALGNLDAKISAEEARKQALDELFRTLLNELMTGRIRVKDLEVEP